MPELSIDEYIDLLRHSDNAGIRANAAWSMGHFRDYRCLQPLLDAVYDEAGAVRARVMEALGSRREPEIADALLVGLHDTDPDVRAMAARAVGSVAPTEATVALMTLLMDEIPNVRAETVQALSKSDEEDINDALVEVFLDDDDATVRHFARQALSERGGTIVISALLEALEAYRDNPPVLIDTIEVLAQLRTKRAKAAYEAFATHDDEGVKATALWALGLLK